MEKSKILPETENLRFEKLYNFGIPLPFVKAYSLSEYFPSTLLYSYLFS